MSSNTGLWASNRPQTGSGNVGGPTFGVTPERHPRCADICGSQQPLFKGAA